MKNVYAQLAKHLDSLPIAYPAIESGIEIKILKRWFTDEEARIALALASIPEPVAAIASRLNMNPDHLAPILEAMSKKGIIFRYGKGENRLYNIVPLAAGMWEFHLNSNTVEDLKDFHEYLDFFMEKGWYGTRTTQHRIVPISQSVTPDMEIMSYE